MLQENMSCEDIIFRVTQGFDMLVYNDAVTPAYVCDCCRARVEKALISMGREEMQKLIDEQGQGRLTANFV